MIQIKNQFVLISLPRKDIKCKCEEIKFIVHKEGITIIGLEGHKVVKSLVPLKYFSSELFSSGFVKVNRGKLINLNCVRKVDYRARTITLESGEIFDVSRRKLKVLKDAMKNV